MYETIEKYLQEVILARPVQQLSALEEERVQHDVFRVSRLAMGGVFMGGDVYLNRIDNHVKSQNQEESPKYLVVTGDAGEIFMNFRFLFSLYYALSLQSNFVEGPSFTFNRPRRLRLVNDNHLLATTCGRSQTQAAKWL